MEVLDKLMHFWPLAKYFVAPLVKWDSDVHLIIHLTNKARIQPSYVYNHVDDVVENCVEGEANYCWILCHMTLGDRRAHYRGKANMVDYSKLPSCG